MKILHKKGILSYFSSSLSFLRPALAGTPPQHPAGSEEDVSNAEIIDVEMWVDNTQP